MKEDSWIRAIIFTLIPLFAALAVTAAAAKAPPDSLEKIQSALPEKPFAAPEKPRKLLIFSKTNGFYHDSIPTGILAFTEVGKKTGAFEVTASNDLANFEQAALDQFDAVCFLNTTLEVFSPSKDEMLALSDSQKATAKEVETRLKKNLMEFIKSGRGFIGIHAAIDTFYEWPEYNEMINGLFDGHPWNAGDQVSIKVEPGQEKNPLAAMFGGKNLDFKEEIYQMKSPYDSKKVNMLLRLDTEKTDMTKSGIHRKDNDFGLSWVRNWGKGRVFFCAVGHNHEMFWNREMLLHYLAGTQWALGDLKVTLSKP